MTLKLDLPLPLRLRRRTTGGAMKAQTVVELLKSRGIKNPSKATIYDCLYEAEHWQQMTDPKGTAGRPYLRYVCSNLFVSRPSHVEKHGIILPADHPFWLLWYPPNGKGCTCTVMSVSEELLERAAAQVSISISRCRFRFQHRESVSTDLSTTTSTIYLTTTTPDNKQVV